MGMLSGWSERGNAGVASPRYDHFLFPCSTGET